MADTYKLYVNDGLKYVSRRTYENYNQAETGAKILFNKEGQKIIITREYVDFGGVICEEKTTEIFFGEDNKIYIKRYGLKKSKQFFRLYGYNFAIYITLVFLFLITILITNTL